MADYLKPQDLLDASRDADALGEVVNGNEAKTVTTRTGRTYPSMAKAIYTIIQNGGFEPFLTQTALLASVPTVPKKAAKAMDTKKVWFWNGSAWADTGLSELDLAKDYVDANPLFKAVTIVAGDNFNNFTQSGLYVLSANLLEGQLTNAPVTNNGYHMSGVLVVAKVNSTVSTQTYYPYLSHYKPTYRSFISTAGGFGAWDSFLFESTRASRKDLTTGQDVLALTAGRYKIPSLVIGNSLVNMVSTDYKMGVVDVDVVGAYKIVRFAPYGRDTNFYTNSSYEGSIWAGWQTFCPLSTLSALFATSGSVTASMAALVDALTQSAYFGKQFTSPEKAGTKLYSSARYAGFNALSGASGTSFNAMQARIFNADSGNVEYRIYTSPTAVVSNVNGYGVANGQVGNYAYAGVCKSFPKSDTGSAQTILFDKAITLPANTPFIIVFKNVNLATFGIASHSAVSGNLETRAFNLSVTNADWGSVTSIGNAATGTYIQAGFTLTVALPASESGGGGTVPAYTPALAMPPKIYVLANLQAHIYPEHLLPESHDLYLHDVTCNVGKQMKCGWVYDVPTTQAAGNIALTWTLADRQTGATLNTATTSVVVADQTKSGTKNVLVIGDSYVNSGAITQRLLDISTTDALKTTLIGTRGAGTNKHEGRGGWKVSDYATVGRTYYQFTVSGIAATPAINSTVYTFGGGTFIVQETAISAGSGTLTCSFSSGTAPTDGSTGTLTKSSGAGDATIAFSNVQSLSGNPFWFSGAINFGQYLSTNSLSTPDIVLIQLGVNDCFGSTTDADVEAIAATAFAQIDALITSIKASNAAVKIGIVSPPTYANQDGFGADYGCGQTAWRAKRNIVTWNKKLYVYFAGKEAQNVYVVAAGLNVDTENNFPTITQAINSQNANTVTVQKSGVHPADSGYKQIGDAMFAFIKVVS